MANIQQPDYVSCFEVVRQLGFKHRVIQAPKGKTETEIDAFKWLNVMLGNLKTAQSGTYHAFKYSKYAGRYLAEMQYRFNRRFDLYALHALLIAKPCPRGRLAEQETSSGTFFERELRQKILP